MNGVIGMTALLLNTDLTPAQRHFCEAARESGESLLKLINNILDFSKIEANKVELESMEFDLLGLLHSVTGTLGMEAQTKGIELLSSVDSNVPTRFNGDPIRLRQIVTNLLGNALKFTSKGEVVLRVGMTEKDTYDSLLRFTVQDTGVGIPEEKLGILFNQFSQVDASTTRNFGGTGLGLAISKQLTELMGGQIGVTSKMGVGSEFWFTVRLGLVKEMTDSSNSLKNLEHLKGVRTLIVDDNKTGRAILGSQAESLGMRTTQVESGPSALTAFAQAINEKDPFMVALINLPEMEVEAVTQGMKEDARLAQTRVVLLAPVGSRLRTLRPRQNDQGACISRPMHREELFTLLSKVLSEALHSSDGVEVRADSASLDSNDGTQRPPARPHARILVAEDNSINRDVALGYLETFGLHADWVCNGAEAVKRLESTSFDLVLMDVRMPVMDGLEATRRIRDANSRVLNHAVPIVAMTASALDRDREVCLTAGMNGFVSKPISLDDLQYALDRWLPAAEGESALVADQSARMEDAKPEIAVFDSLGMLDRMKGNRRLAGKLIDGFLSEMPNEIHTLKEHVGRGDVASAGIAAHSIKGAAACVGAERVKAIALHMERAADSGDLSVIGASLMELEDRMKEFSKVIMEEWHGKQGIVTA